MDQYDIQALRERIGDTHLGERMRAQVDLSVQLLGQGKGGFHLENVPQFIKVLRLVLRVTGLYARGNRNALDVRIRENRVLIRGLPAPFEGLRIAQLSDLHLDGQPGFGQHLARLMEDQRFDLCVLTGDFRFYDSGGHAPVETELRDLMPALQCHLGVYGILGNHDFIEMVPGLESLGIRMLLNESVEHTLDGHSLWMTGLDDAHLYGLHDLETATKALPPRDQAPRILLAHSPELIPEAAAYAFDLYLAGHTHAGQICLPGGWAPIINARCPRKYTAGAWRFRAAETDGREPWELRGYTSSGTGSSGVFVRFFCPPEITIHRLTRAEAED
jgi:uncharacterized protein